MSAKDYELTLDPKRMQLDVIHGYLKDSYWASGIRRDTVQLSIQNSLVLGAFQAPSTAEESQQVAFLRVITDYATFAYICDVFVLEGHRGQGLGKRMIQFLLEDTRLQTLRKWLLATLDAHELYRPFGFEELPNGRWMQRKPPTS